MDNSLRKKIVAAYDILQKDTSFISKNICYNLTMVGKKLPTLIIPKKFSSLISKIPARNVLIVILAIIILFLFKNQFIVATVNGKPITRFALWTELERRSGKSALEGIITEALISQEAEKKGIRVTEKEVEGEVKRIEKDLSSQEQNLDQLLTIQNMTRQDLKRQLKIQLLLKKIVGEQKVTDKEINDFIEKNKESIPQDSKTEEIKKEANAQIEQQKLNEKIQTFVKDLRSKAKVNYWLNL